MAYAKNGYPTELASKLGHVRLIQDPMIQALMEAFDDHKPIPDGYLPEPTDQIDLDGYSPIDQVITIDGGHQPVPNVVRPERQVGFVQVVAQMLKIETIDYLRVNPMADPRDVYRVLGQYIYPVLAALPIAGLHFPGMSLRDSMREVIHRFISRYDLYATMKYLIYQEWETPTQAMPFMDCLKCGKSFELSDRTLSFNCPHCAHTHKLSDYLGLCESDSEDRSTIETISNFRAALEALTLFSFVVRYHNIETIMGRTLFILDGPLLLRAQLSRLVQPIRSFINHQHHNGNSIYMVGAEKTGAFRNFADVYADKLTNSGQFFIPTIKFLVEEINARTYDPHTYRNRVNYAAKVIARLGHHHVLALNVPRTDDYNISPTHTNLIGFAEIARALAKLLSYSHDNALIPIVMANSAASISNQPSGELLAQFLERILNGNH